MIIHIIHIIIIRYHSYSLLFGNDKKYPQINKRSNQTFRKVHNIKRQERVPNTEFPKRANTPSVEEPTQLRRARHLI